MNGHGSLLLLNPRKFLRDVARVATKADGRSKVLGHRVRVLEEKLRLLESFLHLRDFEHRRLVRELGDYLRPVPSGHRYERIGSSGDGGYVVPCDLPLPKSVISVGVGRECSADDDLAARGVDVWQFDHTVESSPSKLPNVRFVCRGLGGPDADGNLLPLKELVRLAGGPLDNTWLMLDAEGAEWDALGDESAPIALFQVISIEFHMLGAAAVPELLAVMLRGVRRVAESHVPVAWSANNFAPFYSFAGVWVPDVLEVTFVRKSVFQPGTKAVPSDLHRRNNEQGPFPPTPFSRVESNPYGVTPHVFAKALLTDSIHMGQSRR